MRFYLALPILAAAVVPAYSAEPDVECAAAAQRFVNMMQTVADQTGKSVYSKTESSVEDTLDGIVKDMTETLSVDPNSCRYLLSLPDSSLQAIVETQFLNEPNDG